MAELTQHQLQGATVAGLQIASAVALFITLGYEADQTPAEVREAFLRCCEELFDETAAEADLTPPGAQLRPRAELLAKIDKLVAFNMANPQGVDTELLSALSEAAERIRAGA